MFSDPIKREIRLILAILGGVALFGFWVIPTSVKDPEGFGYAEGMPPSFTPNLVAWLAVLVLVLRLVHMAWPMVVQRMDAPGPAITEVAEEPTRPIQAVLSISACLLYAMVFVPYLGFYISGLALIFTLILILGERRIVIVLGVPVVMLGGVYLLFEVVLTIILPPGSLMTMLSQFLVE